MDSIIKNIKIVKESISEKSELYEIIKRESFHLIRESARTIQAMHRDERVDIKTLKETFRKIKELVGNRKEFLYESVTETGMQEYVEAVLFYHYKYEKGMKMPSAEDLKVTGESYILGVMDFTGEMKRDAVISIKKGDIQKAEQILQYIELIYDETMEFDNYMVSPSMKRKQDVLRNIIEKLSDQISFLAMEKLTIKEMKRSD